MTRARADLFQQNSAPTSSRPADPPAANKAQPANIGDPLATTKRVLTPQDKNLLGKSENSSKFAIFY